MTKLLVPCLILKLFLKFSMKLLPKLVLKLHPEPLMSIELRPLSPGPNALMPLVRSGAMLTSKGDLGTSAPAKVTMTMCRPTLTGVYVYSVVCSSWVGIQHCRNGFTHGFTIQRFRVRHGLSCGRNFGLLRVKRLMHSWRCTLCKKLARH